MVDFPCNQLNVYRRVVCIQWSQHVSTHSMTIPPINGKNHCYHNHTQPSRSTSAKPWFNQLVVINCISYFAIDAYEHSSWSHEPVCCLIVIWLFCTIWCCNHIMSSYVVHELQLINIVVPKPTMFIQTHYWLVVSTPEKYISQPVHHLLIPGKIKKVNQTTSQISIVIQSVEPAIIVGYSP